MDNEIQGEIDLNERDLKNQMREGNLEGEDVMLLYEYGGERARNLHKRLGSRVILWQTKLVRMIVERNAIKRRLDICMKGLRHSYLGFTLAAIVGFISYIMAERIESLLPWENYKKLIISTMCATHAVAILTLYDIGRVYNIVWRRRGAMKKISDFYKEEEERELSKIIKPKEDEEGRWVSASEIAKSFGCTPIEVGRELKKRGFENKRKVNGSFWKISAEVELKDDVGGNVGGNVGGMEEMSNVAEEEVDSYSESSVTPPEDADTQENM